MKFDPMVEEAVKELATALAELRVEAAWSASNTIQLFILNTLLVRGVLQKEELAEQLDVFERRAAKRQHLELLTDEYLMRATQSIRAQLLADTSKPN